MTAKVTVLRVWSSPSDEDNPSFTEASLPYTAIKRVNKYSISDDPRRWAARFDSPGDVILGSRAGRRWRVAYGRVNVRRAVRRTPLISCEPAQNLTSNVSTRDNQVDGSHLAVLTSRWFVAHSLTSPTSLSSHYDSVLALQKLLPPGALEIWLHK